MQLFIASLLSIIFLSLSFSQAAYMKINSELMGRCGITHQSHVLSVLAVTALSSVRGNGVLPPTVNTQSREIAACPVMVRT